MSRLTMVDLPKSREKKVTYYVTTVTVPTAMLQMIAAVMEITRILVAPSSLKTRQVQLTRKATI